MGNHRRHLNRRDFLKLGTGALGGVLIAACRRGQPRVDLTATPAPAPTSPAFPTLPAGTFADTVLVNGNIITMDPSGKPVQALAIKDGLIMQTGTSDKIRALAGPKTQTTDLRGKTVTPGLVDSHNHLNSVGLIGTVWIDINPPAVKTIADLQARTKEWAAKCVIPYIR